MRAAQTSRKNRIRPILALLLILPAIRSGNSPVSAVRSITPQVPQDTEAVIAAPLFSYHAGDASPYAAPGALGAFYRQISDGKQAACMRLSSFPQPEPAGTANVGDALLFLRVPAAWPLYCGGIAVAGVLLLLITAIHHRWRSRRTLRELKMLQEKNSAMESLTRRTRELAHHQRLETIGTLTSGIAHEFNNLLTPMMGYSLLTLEQLSPEDEELYDNVLAIYQASCKARDIVSRLSELSRKNVSPSFRMLSPDELVSKVLHVAAPARPAGVLVVEQLNGGSCRIPGNETLLSQLLLNLILNAFQAMGPEGGTLTVSTSAESGSAVFRVRDTGPGIPANVLPSIFEPFFTTKGSGGGTGLGLAIAQQIAEEHNGEIRVDTQLGQGCTFTVRLPLAPRDISPGGKEETPP